MQMIHFRPISDSMSRRKMPPGNGLAHRHAPFHSSPPVASPFSTHSHHKHGKTAYLYRDGAGGGEPKEMFDLQRSRWSFILAPPQRIHTLCGTYNRQGTAPPVYKWSERLQGIGPPCSAWHIVLLALVPVVPAEKGPLNSI